MSARIENFITTIAKVVIAVGLAVLIGWQFSIDALKSILPDLLSMNPMTAFAFIATGLWQLLQVTNARKKEARLTPVAFLLATLVFGMGASKIVDLLITSKDYGVDLLLYKDQIGASRMSELSAMCFTLFGLAMMLVRFHLKREDIILCLLVPVFTLAMVSFFGYVIGNNSAETLKPFKPMAVHSSVCFLLLTASFLFLFPANSISQALFRKDSGGYVARSLLPYVFAVPFIIGYFRYVGERSDYYDTGFGVALFAVGSMLTFMFIVIRQSRILSDHDQRRRAAEQKAAEHVKELELRNQELEQFSYAASHDMQEPLRKIRLFNNLLLTNTEKHLDEETRAYLSKIDVSSRRMKNIIDDLLNYSHGTRQDEVLHPTALNEVVSAVEIDLEMAVQEKNATILVDSLPVIQGVPSQMHQLFYNLISNALKFTRPGVAPTIRISCSEAGEHLFERFSTLDRARRYYHFSFEDNGIGFEPEYSGKIFHLFSRLHSRTDYTGTGVGLALCKKVVDNHGGVIWAEGTPGAGAVFHVVLPAG